MGLFRRRKRNEPNDAARVDSLEGIKVPGHVAVIMDGNGRWAQSRSLPRLIGHRKGVDTVKVITRTARDMGIKYLTLYTFSTENWKRSDEEVNGLMALVEEVLSRELAELSREGARIRFMGRREGLSGNVLRSMEDAETKTAANTGLNLILALNYGGRPEIIDAVRTLAEKVRDGVIDPSGIGEDSIRECLYLPELPDPDLMIRTGGEIRLSNFLMWQSAYTELWVTSKFWPDFTAEDFIGAVKDFQYRERRYGGTNRKQEGPK